MMDAEYCYKCKLTHPAGIPCEMLKPAEEEVDYSIPSNRRWEKKNWIKYRSWRKEYMRRYRSKLRRDSHGLE
jgi:hypothetical protein